MADRLYRSRDDRMLAGVAGGLAKVMDADPSIIRVVWVVVAVLSGGIGLLVYIVMAVVVPEAPDGWDAARSVSSAAAAVAATPREPVPPGGWLGPDGTVVPYAGAPTSGTPPGAATTAGETAALAATTPPATATGWTAPPRRASGDGRAIAAIFGGILILIGGVFFIREFMPAVDMSAVWPVISIGFGVVLLILAVRPRRSSD